MGEREKRHADYENFVKKFEPKRTTDDCFTPPNVYAAVCAWAAKRYALEGREIVRPFFPGGDYERFDYPDGCVVIDNPPFSILAKIVHFYRERGIAFFLFAPSLTMLGHARHPGVAAVFGANDITFENGAVVSCGFLTSLEDADTLAVSAPVLGDAVAEAEKENRKIGKKHVTPLSLPNEIITAARMQYLASHHIPFTVRKSEAVFVRKLDSYPGGLFGGGFLLSERAAAERAAAERAAAGRAVARRCPLSERERDIVRKLGTRE